MLQVERSVEYCCVSECGKTLMFYFCNTLTGHKVLAYE